MTRRIASSALRCDFDLSFATGNRAAALALIALAVWSACRADEADLDDYDRTSSLTRLAVQKPGPFGRNPYSESGRAGVAVWEHDRDRRTTLYQRAPHSLRLGPLPGGGACWLHFGISRHPEASSATPELLLRVHLERGASSKLLFEETLSRRDAGWRDFRVPIPAPDEPFELVLGVDLAEARVDTEEKPLPLAGWGAPHLGCRGGAGAPAPASPARPHVVLISIDTLRADHLGLYGYERPTSPELDAFAQGALVFDFAFATAPWTVPSHASMLTGLYPDQHRAGHDTIGQPLSPRVPTLAELLGRAGYRSLAFTGGYGVGRSAGLARGFDEWSERPRANLRSVLPEVLHALDEEPGRPTFLFLHTFDVHGPFDQPARHRYFEAQSRPDAKGRRAWIEARAGNHQAFLELDRYAGVEELVAAYDSSIRFTDSQLGPLLRRLEASGFLDDALVIVTSDHGESLLEAGVYAGHALDMREKELRIPLIVRGPRVAPGRSQELVDLSDLLPLVLATVGLEIPPHVSGSNPLARMRGAEPARRFVLGEGAFTGNQFARSRDWKIITPREPHRDLTREFLARSEAGARVFDLRRDPLERQNLAEREELWSDEVRRLRDELSRREPPRASPEQERGSPELEEKLRALGYIE